MKGGGEVKGHGGEVKGRGVVVKRLDVVAKEVDVVASCGDRRRQWRQRGQQRQQ